MKKIVVIGTGRMGGAFATAFAKRTSHAVSIRGSHAGSPSAAACDDGRAVLEKSRRTDLYSGGRHESRDECNVTDGYLQCQCSYPCQKEF